MLPVPCNDVSAPDIFAKSSENICDIHRFLFSVPLDLLRFLPQLSVPVERVLNIYSVDENSQLHPYADIPYAYVDLEKEMIYALGRDDDRYYGISFYGYRELREKAEQILGDRKEKTVDITYIFG